MEDIKPDDLKLREEFPPPSWEEWKSLVNDTLKGVPYDKVMNTQTYEGITLNPIYRMEDIQNLAHLDALPGSAPYVRGNNPDGYISSSWLLAQRQDNPDLEQLNKDILDELNRGLNALNFDLHPDSKALRIPVAATGRGIALSTLEDMKSLLAGVDVSAVPLMINSGEGAIVFLGMFNAYIKEIGYDLSKLEASIGIDPLGSLAKTGELHIPLEMLWQAMYQMTFWADLKAPHIRTIQIDSTVYADAGASDIQELAFALATAIGYIRGLLDSGLSIEQIAPHLQLNLSLGSNFFMEIAKIRAARMLFAEMIKAFGGSESSSKIFIHGVTANYNKSTYDPYVNILRTSTEAFSGVIGGVDSLEVTPFDYLNRTPDDFSKRIARNQQIILREEASFDKVVDPAGGCFYIESLTAEMANKAWALMQEIESEGGMFGALQNGAIHARVAGVAFQRKDNVNKRKDVFVGVNMFSDPNEERLCIQESESNWLETHQARVQKVCSDQNGKSQSLDFIGDNLNNDFLVDMITDAWLHGATIDDFGTLLTGKTDLQITKLFPMRAMQDIETLRNRIVASQERNTISIAMLCIGNLATLKPRIDFALGFLQVGSFNVINNGTFSDVATALSAYNLESVKTVCICGSDESYPLLVPEICEQLKGWNIILAGYPQEHVDNFKALGVNSFIHLRANVYETLSEIAMSMGV